MDSLGRIKKRQEETANRIAAGAELAAIEDGTDLDRQLREAGIGGATQSADDILAQLMAPAPEQATLPPPNKRLT
jgi:phage shock protein A